MHAPTKSFNLAGLQTSAVVVPNKELRHKVWHGLNTDETAEPNVFAITAEITAWTHRILLKVRIGFHLSVKFGSFLYCPYKTSGISNINM